MMRNLRWGDVAQLKYGKSIRAYPEESSESHRFRVFGTNGPIGWHTEPLVKKAGIIIGRKGAYRGVHFSASPFFVIDTAFYLDITDPEVDIKWAYYQLLTVDINRMDSGSAIPSTKREDFDAVPVRIPSKAVQMRIAGVLSTYDDLIENNRRRMALLKESAQQLYQEWFVRFRFPGHEHTHIKDGVPEGWRQMSVSTLAECRKVDLQTGPFGTQLRASDYTEEGTPVINVRNIGYGDIWPEKIEHIPEDVLDRLRKHILNTGDIVFGRKGAVDRHALITTAQNGWVQGSDCIRMRSVSEDVPLLLLSLAFRESSHKEWMLTQCSNKATMASLNQDVLGRIKVVLPTATVRNPFIDLVSPMMDQVELLERQCNSAQVARDLLLPRLMSGEVAV